MVGIVLLGIFVVLLVFGAPIAVCLGMSSVGAILAQGAGKPLDAIMSVLPRLCSSASSKFVLLAIPFFILSGNVMEKAGISGRLINLAEKCLGHIRGGMAMVCVVVSCFFRLRPRHGGGLGPDHDPRPGKGRISRRLLLRSDGGRRRHRRGDPAVHHLCRVWFYCGRLHHRPLQGRRDPRSADGRRLDRRCAGRRPEDGSEGASQGHRQGALESVQGCILGSFDARHHPRRYPPPRRPPSPCSTG